VLACASALVVGGFISLFTAGPALFADGPFGQRPLVLGFSALAFAFLGLAIGFLVPGAWKPAAVCLACSALPVVVLFGRDTASQLPMALLSVGFMLGDAAAGVLGVWSGMRLRSRTAIPPGGSGDSA
jgi:hypothetical protein